MPLQFKSSFIPVYSYMSHMNHTFWKTVDGCVGFLFSRYYIELLEIIGIRNNLNFLPFSY